MRLISSRHISSDPIEDHNFFFSNLQTNFHCHLVGLLFGGDEK
jgi:hypothetical protein